jgi:hypothetical protein
MKVDSTGLIGADGADQQIRSGAIDSVRTANPILYLGIGVVHQGERRRPGNPWGQQPNPESA